MESFKLHGTQSIKDLRVELMHDFVVNQLVPELVSRLKIEVDDGVTTTLTNEDIAAFLLSYGLTTLSITTMSRWMHAVGFRYKKREKHYLVDGHERPETIAYKPIFTNKYLLFELRTHRWIQITKVDSKLLESNGDIAENCGFYYKSDDGVEMVEYHVDASYKFQDKIDELPFGGNLSVRKNLESRPVMSFIGQDEAIYKQFLVLSKMWVGSKGERLLLAKDEGTSSMISAFVCREHGLLQQIPINILAEINLRRLGKIYTDEEDAIEVYGGRQKKPLKAENSPFLVVFDYGENREGYWNYAHMVLQFEDAVDVLQVLYPTFDFVFLFDHSAGHSKQQIDGLNQFYLNKFFGGRYSAMRETVIEREQGFFGPFPQTLNVGDTQQMNVENGHVGPFWTSPTQREATRHDIQLGTTSTNEKHRSALELDLKTKGINTKGKNKKELVQLCVLHEIPTVINVEHFREGWEGRAKGLLQVLWERAFIDSTNLNRYTLTGTKRELGIVNKVNSLRHIMGMCADFLNEEGMLQYIATKIGVTVLLTPKCHAELAGEGIEYMWACSKGAYRNLSLKEKKGKENFNASVCHCLSEQIAVTVRRIRKFAWRACQYLMAYHAIDSGQVDQQTQQGYSKYGPVALTRLINEFKTHQCAFDFDYKFVRSVMNDDRWS